MESKCEGLCYYNLDGLKKCGKCRGHIVTEEEYDKEFNERKKLDPTGRLDPFGANIDVWKRYRERIANLVPYSEDWLLYHNKKGI